MVSSEVDNTYTIGWLDWLKYVKLLTLISCSKKLLGRGKSLKSYISLADRPHLLFDFQGPVDIPLENIEGLLNNFQNNSI